MKFGPEKHGSNRPGSPASVEQEIRAIKWYLLYLIAILSINGNNGGNDAALTKMEKRIMAKFDALEAEVARNRSVDESALLLIQGIVAKLEEAAGDPAKIAALTAELAASSDALAAAVAANTPPPAEPPVV